MLLSFEQLEVEYFRMLNGIVEPMVRFGFGSPGLFPVGAIVLETKGRRTGRPSSVPLMAARARDFVLVSTVRRGSHWFRNLSAQPDVRYWLGGQETKARAFTIRNGSVIGDDPPESARCIVELLRTHSTIFGTGFAILIPSGAEC